MLTMRMSARREARPDSTVTEEYRETSIGGASDSQVLEGELLDLYGAILVAVPMAFVLKSLWS